MINILLKNPTKKVLKTKSVVISFAEVILVGFPLMIRRKMPTKRLIMVGIEFSLEKEK